MDVTHNVFIQSALESFSKITFTEYVFAKVFTCSSILMSFYNSPIDFTCFYPKRVRKLFKKGNTYFSCHRNNYQSNFLSDHRKLASFSRSALQSSNIWHNTVGISSIFIQSALESFSKIALESLSFYQIGFIWGFVKCFTICNHLKRSDVFRKQISETSLENEFLRVHYSYFFKLTVS